jgi:uncharacterized protein (TIGR01777 family)
LPIDGLHFIEHLTEIKPDNDFDAVVNLAGAPIAKRWTPKYKQIIQKSRVELTKNVVKTIGSLSTPPKVMVSGSAIGFYGPQGDSELSESAEGMESFSNELCQAWENAANEASHFGVRVVNLRTGIVLAKKGGALAKMRLPFLLGLGGPIGNGQQWMSWVHLDDIVNIIQFCLQENIHGPVNAVSPNPVTNKSFAQSYAKALHRPAILPMPAWFLRLTMGQMADELLITGQRVIPTKLLNSGFDFAFSDLEKALNETH